MYIPAGIRPNFVQPEILLHPNIPKPLHGVNPRTIKGRSWWDEVRKEAYQKNNYCCWACGIPKSRAKYHRWLEAHESYDIDYAVGRVELVEIVALCHCCHNFIHDGRMEILMQKGEMPYLKFRHILRRGHKILGKYHLSKSDLPDVPTDIAKWSDWHLVLDGEKYYSPYKNIDEWYAFYN